LFNFDQQPNCINKLHNTTKTMIIVFKVKKATHSNSFSTQNSKCQGHVKRMTDVTKCCFFNIADWKKRNPQKCYE